MERMDGGGITQLRCGFWECKNMDRVTNKAVRNKAKTSLFAMKAIRKRQATFIGYDLRSKGLGHLAIIGKLKGKLSGGRQREKIMDSVTIWLEDPN